MPSFSPAIPLQCTPTLNSDHVLEVLGEEGIVPFPILKFMIFLNKTNYFHFSNKVFHQIDGTAMSTPLACALVTLYFGPHEWHLLEEFARYLMWWKHLIDNGIGLWIWDGTRECQNAWFRFSTMLNEYGKLRWTIEQPA